jgi:hypothetical protein
VGGCIRGPCRWLNAYNGRVRAELSEVFASTPPERWEAWQVTHDEAMAFLLKETEPLEPMTAASTSTLARL